MATLRELRRRAAAELGPFLASVAAGTSSTSKLMDETWPVKSTLDQATLYQDEFLFRPAASAAADRERIVKTYDPATGSLFPDKTWSAAPAAGEVYELLGLVQPTRLHEAINDALQNCYLVDVFTFTPTSTDARRHDLTREQAWLTNELWVRQVGYLASGEDRDESDPFKRRVYGRAIKEGSQVYLEHQHGFNTTDTVYVKALKPAYAACRRPVAYDDPTNLLLNPDFALGAGDEFTNWTATRLVPGGTVTATYWTMFAADRAVKCATGLGGSGNVSQAVAVTAGDTYRLAARVMSSAGYAAQLTVARTDSGAAIYSGALGALSDGKHYEDASLYFTVPSGCNNITVYLTAPNAAAQWSMWDNVLLLHQLNTYVSISGLVEDTDDVPISQEWGAAATLVEAWRRFGQALEPAAKDNLMRDRSDAWLWFKAERNDNLVVPELTLRPFTSWGPRR